MKKLVMISLAIMVVLGMSLSVFAATGGFIVSPSRNQAPELVGVKPADDDCEIESATITAYADRDQLSGEARGDLEEAYAKIMGTPNIGDLNAAIVELATKIGAKVEDLAVSDLFDIQVPDCDGHGNHGEVTITFEAETLANFVCLLHYYNGEWIVIDNATVSEDGTELTFGSKEFSPFAIIVNTGIFEDVDVETVKNVATAVSISVATGAAVLGAPMAYYMVQFKKKKISFK